METQKPASPQVVRICLISEVAKRRLCNEIKNKRLPANLTIDADPLPDAKGSRLGVRLRVQVRLLNSRKEKTRPVFVMNWSCERMLATSPRSLVSGFFGMLLQQQLVN